MSRLSLVKVPMSRAGLTHQQINGQGRQLLANPLITHVLRSLTIKDFDEYILEDPLYLECSKAVTLF